MNTHATPLQGNVATLQELSEYGLLGLQDADPQAGWQRVEFGNNEVRAFSAAHPEGTELSYHDLLTAAASGLSKKHPDYAGCSFKGAFDGLGLIGADLV